MKKRVNLLVGFLILVFVIGGLLYNNFKELEVKTTVSEIEDNQNTNSTNSTDNKVNTEDENSNGEDNSNEENNDNSADNQEKDAEQTEVNEKEGTSNETDVTNVDSNKDKSVENSSDNNNQENQTNSDIDIDIADIPDKIDWELKEEPVGTEPMENNTITNTARPYHKLQSDGTINVRFMDSYFEGSKFVVILKIGNTTYRELTIPKKAFNLVLNTIPTGKIMPVNLSEIKLPSKSEKEVKLVFNNIKQEKYMTLYMGGSTSSLFKFKVSPKDAKEEIVDTKPIVKTDENQGVNIYGSYKINYVLGDGKVKMALNEVYIREDADFGIIEEQIGKNLYLGEVVFTIANTSDEDISIKSRNIKTYVSDREKMIAGNLPMNRFPIYYKDIEVPLSFTIKANEIKKVSVPTLLSNDLFSTLEIRIGISSFAFAGIQDFAK